MKLTFLGTGTSHGIPAIGCTCDVCQSDNRRNRRRRSSLYIQAGGVHVVIDTPPDFRDQALTFNVARVDAVLLTHAHADHIFGFDDLRRFCFLQKMIIPVYGSSITLASMREKFGYVFEDSLWRKSVPQVTFCEVDQPFQVGALQITPLPVPHGPMQVYGYLIEADGHRVAYIPDCSAVPEELMTALPPLDVMILDALRDRPHPTHLTVDQAVDALQRIGADRSYLTHLCHDLEHEATQQRLPAGIHVAYDGLRIDLSRECIT